MKCLSGWSVCWRIQVPGTEVTSGHRDKELTGSSVGWSQPALNLSTPHYCVLIDKRPEYEIRCTSVTIKTDQRQHSKKIFIISLD